jgi:hypothetical protein
MSYFRLDNADLVVSADAAVQPLWSSGNITQTDFFTSTTQASSTQGNYYLSIYNGDPTTSATASVQFDITFGDLNGSGSAPYNTLVDGASPTRTIYGQYRNLIFGDENTPFTFSVNGASAVTSSNFWVINFNRTNYKEHLFPASLNLTLQSGSSAVNSIVLTDNSKDVTINSFCDAGRIYDIVSGTDGSAAATSNGNASPGFTMSGSYGYFLPDIDTIILNPLAVGLSGSVGGIGIGGNDTPDLTNSNPSTNFNRLFSYIDSGSSFQIQSEETITSDYVFCRVRNSQANYSINPSFISSSTGEIIDPVLINSPEVYITAVGMYNDSNELLAVAKLSRPLRKDFTKEALVRVKLDF